MEGPFKTLKDRYNVVYMIFILQGVGMLMPFNMFINANDYFVRFKLVLSANETDRSYYQRLFLQNLTFASMIPQLIFLWVNIYLPHKGRKNAMVVLCLIVSTGIFLFTVILAMLDSTTWTPTFFWLTMVSMVPLNMANGVYQSIIYGLAFKLPPRYIGGVVLGNNIAGIFTALIAILAMYIDTNLQYQGVYYFIAAIVVLLACMDTYLVLPLNKYYRIYRIKDQMRKSSEMITSKTPYWEIYKKTFLQLANVCMIFVVTSSVFPAIQANVQRSNRNFFLSSEMFMHITCFLTFNIFASIGSWAANLVQWPKKKYLIIPVLLRFLYIPFFLFCNYQVFGVSRRLPVYIVNDWLYWTGSATMALTSGYWSSVGLQYVPTYVQPRHAYVAGMFGIAMLVSGIFVGITIAYLWPKIIRSIG